MGCESSSEEAGDSGEGLESSVAGVNIMQRIHRLDIRGAALLGKSIIHRAKEVLWWWFGHLERMDINNMTWRV